MWVIEFSATGSEKPRMDKFHTRLLTQIMDLVTTTTTTWRQLTNWINSWSWWQYMLCCTMFMIAGNWKMESYMTMTIILSIFLCLKLVKKTCKIHSYFGQNNTISYESEVISCWIKLKKMKAADIKCQTESNTLNTFVKSIIKYRKIILPLCNLLSLSLNTSSWLNFLLANSPQLYL